MAPSRPESNLQKAAASLKSGYNTLGILKKLYANNKALIQAEKALNTTGEELQQAIHLLDPSIAFIQESLSLLGKKPEAKQAVQGYNALFSDLLRKDDPVKKEILNEKYRKLTEKMHGLVQSLGLTLEMAGPIAEKKTTQIPTILNEINPSREDLLRDIRNFRAEQEKKKLEARTIQTQIKTSPGYTSTLEETAKNTVEERFRESPLRPD